MVWLGISAQQSHRIQRGVKASVKQTRWRRSGLALVIPIVVSWGGSAAAVEAQSALDGLTAEFLREAAEEIKQKDRSAAAREFEQETYPTEVGEEEAFQVTPARPAGAFDHAGQEATSAETESAPLARETLKMAPEEGEEEPIVPQPEPGARPLSFSSGSVMHQQGIDDRLETAVDAASAADAEERFTYAFALTSEYPSQQMEEELNALGVEILGPHDDAVKIKLPLNREVLHELMNLAYVEWVGYSQPEQKIESTLAGAMASFADEVEEFPVIINLFEDDSDGRFAARLQEIGVALGHYDPDLQSYRAAASLAEIDALAALDFVLFIETERPTSPGHDQSMATMGVDYIRPGGSGTRFSGASTVLGIMDTGFMVGDAAAVTHVDLDKFGCGRNFTTDAADVWNDQNGHRTHVLGTIVGTGTGEARYRGVAIGVGTTAATRIRAAKIWRSDGRGSQSWMEDAIDYMGEESDCDSPRPLVVNISGGAQGTGQTGTDSTSRKLDDAVWANRQAYIVCGGNTGPNDQTIWSPGVAKNAITVGNVLDNGYQTVGDVNNGSSRGPTGDGRMKPNLVGTGTLVTSARAGTTDQYSDLQGCSMATPHVSGIAATLMEHYPEFRDRPDLLRAHLMSAALLHDDVTTPDDNSSGGRNDYGLGRVSSYVSHWARFNANGWSTRWAWRTVTDTAWAFHDITVPAGTDRLVVVMTWDEPAASAGASRAVTYDLDLWIDHQADCVPDARGQCGEWASRSGVDNTEYLIINNPPAGTHRLKIINWNAPSFGLPASIAATIIRGDPTPAMTLSATAPRPLVGSNFTVTTRVSGPSYVTSGAHLAVTAVAPGLELRSVRTTREDGVAMDFGVTQELTLGNIIERDARVALWEFRVSTEGNKTLSFRAWSENGGEETKRIRIRPRPGRSAVAELVH